MQLTKTVVWRNGPFGSPGTVMWLCEEHHQLINTWNTQPLPSQDAVKSAMDISRAAWNDDPDVVRECEGRQD